MKITRECFLKCWEITVLAWIKMSVFVTQVRRWMCSIQLALVFVTIMCCDVWYKRSQASNVPLNLSLSPPALLCYCDRCSANSSCTTDGVCFVAYRKSGSRLTTEQRQCVPEMELIPRDRPFICAPSVKQDTGIYPVCCTTDYCNKDTTPNISGKHTYLPYCIYLWA